MSNDSEALGQWADRALDEMEAELREKMPELFARFQELDLIHRQYDERIAAGLAEYNNRTAPTTLAPDDKTAP